MNSTAFTTSCFSLLLCLLGAGCASVNSNGRLTTEQSGIYVAPLLPTEQAGDAGNRSRVVAHSVAKPPQTIVTGIKRYDALSTASMIWPDGIDAENPALVVFIRTFSTAGNFRTSRIEDRAEEIVRQARNRLESANYSIAPRILEDLQLEIASNHSDANQVSFVALFLLHPSDFDDGTMNISLLGYEYPVLKARNSAVASPFAQGRLPESYLSLTIGGRQGRPNDVYRAEFVAGPEAVYWKRNDDILRLNEWGEIGAETSGIRNIPYYFPPDGPVEVSIRLIEASDLVKTLKSWGEAVRGLNELVF